MDETPPMIPIPNRLRSFAPIVAGGVVLLAGAGPAAAFDLFKRPPAEPAYVPEPEAPDRATMVRLQVYLDEQLFPPGVIDGRIGEFTRKAIAHFNAKHAVQPVDNWAVLLEASAKAVPEPFTTYTLREEDLAFIDASLPVDFARQAERKALPYRRASEFISERFHTSEEFLAELNPGVSMSGLRPGASLKVPNVTPFRIEDIPRHFHFQEEAGLSGRHVIVDTALKIAAVWEPDGTLVASFPITPGKDRFIHRGDWKLSNMVTTPEFRYDKSLLEEGVRSESYHQLPPGPNSPVGIIWCGTSKSGIGLHGTASPHTIGRSRSAGCIRLANWDAVRLPTLLRPGAKVTIR